MVVLVFIFNDSLKRTPWKQPPPKRMFAAFVLLVVMLLGMAGMSLLVSKLYGPIADDQTAYKLANQ